MAKLAIIVPVYNEEDNIVPLAEEIVSVFNGFDQEWELVFVDDGSTDSSWNKILQVSEAFPQIRGIRHLRNVGQSAALWTGFKLTDSDWIATLDGDLQNDPADLLQMVNLLKEYDFISGDRSKSRKDSFIRRVSSTLAKWARMLILGYNFRDTGCGLRVFKRKVLEGLVPFNGMHRFLPILVADEGWRTVEIPVNHRPRVAGRSKYGIWNRLWRGLYDLIGIKWFQKRRIKFPPIVESPKYK